MIPLYHADNGVPPVPEWNPHSLRGALWWPLFSKLYFSIAYSYIRETHSRDCHPCFLSLNDFCPPFQWTVSCRLLWEGFCHSVYAVPARVEGPGSIFCPLVDFLQYLSFCVSSPDVLTRGRGVFVSGHEHKGHTDQSLHTIIWEGWAEIWLERALGKFWPGCGGVRRCEPLWTEQLINYATF